MSVLRVQGDELTRLAAGLASSSERLGEVSAALGSADSSGLGSSDLEGACEEFNDSWHYGVGQLGKLAGDASGFLRSTVDTFANADHELSASLRRAAQA